MLHVLENRPLNSESSLLSQKKAQIFIPFLGHAYVVKALPVIPVPIFKFIRRHTNVFSDTTIIN